MTCPKAAWLWPNLTMRRSVGGALHVRTSIGNLPVTLFFEVAERFDGNEKPLGVLGIALE